MRTISFLRVVVPLVGAGLLSSGLLAGCSPGADNPYAAIKGAPLVRATAHTVTLVSAEATLVDRLRQDGYAPMPAAPNYPGAVRVEAALWKVPEDVAANPLVFMAPNGRGPNVRILATPPVAPLPAGARVQAWTFLIDDVLVARRQLREAGIPIDFDAVAITTAYLGDHKLLGIKAPDGVILELVETAAR